MIISNKKKTLGVEMNPASDARASFGNVKQQILALAKDVSEVMIVDESSLQIATNISIKLNGVLKLVETKRKTLKEPSIIEGRVIDSIAKELSEDGSKAIKTAKDKILEYHNKVKEIKSEELIADNEELPDFLQTPIEELVKIIDNEKINGLRKTLDYKIIDENNIPRSWLTLDVEKVKDYMKDHKAEIKEGDVINGIEFYYRETIVLR